MVSKFNRTLPECGLAYLETLPAWWMDLLNYRFKDIGGKEQSLFLAIRNGYLNAYIEGQSILKVGFETRQSSTVLNGEIHHKYVVEGVDGQRYFKFDGSNIGGKPYHGRSSLDDWAAKAQKYATLEKQGVAAIAGRNAKIIDVEMALPANKAVGPEKRISAPRMDIVALEKEGEDIKIVFYEAKLFKNPELRADNLKPRVLNQLKRYEDWINSDHRANEVVEAYRRACRILIRLNATRSEAAQPIHFLITEAAKSDSNLRVDRMPRLIIFGYKPEERNAYWERHELALRSAGIHGHRLIMEPRPEDVVLLDERVAAT